MQEKKILVISIAVLAFLVLLPVVMAGEDDLFMDKGQPHIEQDAAVANAKLIEINWNALNKGHNKQIQLNLFEGAEMTAVRERVDRLNPESYVWVGHMQGFPNNSITLSVFEQTLVGSIIVEGYEKYTIRNDGPGQILRQVDPKQQIEVELEDIIQAPKLPYQNPDRVSYCEDGSQIDLLVAYTSTARQKLGGTAATKALINQRISDMNSANANSGLTFRYDLVHTVETNYPETGDVAAILPQLKQTNDGILDHIASARDTYKADLVSLIVSEARVGAPCGIAYVMNELSTNFSSYAYNVVALDYTGSYLTCNPQTLAHEFGHNMGNQHDRAADSSPPLLPFAHGYQSPTQSFRTIMAYNCPSGCPRINYWSNPDITVLGENIGIDHEINSSQSADNGRSMEETVLHVANFRENCAVSTGPTPTSTPAPGAVPTATPPASSLPYGYKSYAPTLFKK